MTAMLGNVSGHLERMAPIFEDVRIEMIKSSGLGGFSASQYKNKVAQHKTVAALLKSAPIGSKVLLVELIYTAAGEHLRRKMKNEKRRRAKYNVGGEELPDTVTIRNPKWKDGDDQEDMFLHVGSEFCTIWQVGEHRDYIDEKRKEVDESHKKVSRQYDTLLKRAGGDLTARTIDHSDETYKQLGLPLD